MIEWIRNNKQWLFSGIGVATISAICWLIANMLDNKGEGVPSHTSEPATLRWCEYNLRPLPQAISQEIKMRPPYQREDAGRYYVGLRVRWRLSLSSVRKGTEGVAEFQFTPPGRREPQVKCAVPMASYPELKIATEGSELWVSGRIAGVTLSTIRLSDVLLEFDQLMPTAPPDVPIPGALLLSIIGAALAIWLLSARAPKNAK